MEISARVLADSLSPCGARLTTMEWMYPRSIHSEIMTHRALSKNAASSRAIPINKMLNRIKEDPFIPKVWGTNQKGMQGGDELEGGYKDEAVERWIEARNSAVIHARELQILNLHKQIVNRVVEPWMWCTIIVSATDWENVWGLRCHEAAEPHFQELAYKARDALNASTPQALKAGQWHLPLIHPEDWEAVIDRLGYSEAEDPDEFTEEVRRILVKVSVGRCARVSYLTHEGKRDLKADVELHDRLIVQRPAHASPAEHVAQALDWPKWYKNWHSTAATTPKRVLIPYAGVRELRDAVVARRQEIEDCDNLIENLPEDLLADETCLGVLTSGNFLGFKQYRKTLQDENIGGRMP